MKSLCKSIQVFTLGALVLLVSTAAYGQKNLDQSTAAVVTPGRTSSQVRLKLVDGSDISADEAWESEQGIWYRRGGMSHLVTRDRIKAIERGPTSQPNADPQLAKIVIANDSETGADSSNSSPGQPVWIYLVGGARVEADSAIESAAGVWYRRGSLSVFVERSRIDHIEREALGNSGRIRLYFQKSTRLDYRELEDRQLDQAQRCEVWRRSVPDLLRDGAGVPLQHARAVAKGSAGLDAANARYQRAVWR